MIAYRFNYDAMLKKLFDPATGNALRAFIAGIGIGCSKEMYDTLPDWAKAYWIAFEVEKPKKKAKRKK